MLWALNTIQFHLDFRVMLVKFLIILTLVSLSWGLEIDSVFPHECASTCPRFQGANMVEDRLLKKKFESCPNTLQKGHDLNMFEPGVRICERYPVSHFIAKRNGAAANSIFLYF